MATGTLLLDGGRLPVPSQVIRSIHTDLAVRFKESSGRAWCLLIVCPFDGGYVPDSDRVRRLPVLSTVVQPLLK